MAIEGYVGRPGSGKTYTLTERALREASRGRQVYSNYFIDHPNAVMFRPEDLLHLPPGVVVLDEAHLWFPSRQAIYLPPSWLMKMSQTRKSGWDVLWSAQHENRVDRVIRDVSSTMWLCSAWLQAGGHPVIFVAESYEPEFFRNPKKRQTRRVRWYSQAVADSYDTFESVAVATHANRKNDPYAAAGA